MKTKILSVILTVVLLTGFLPVVPAALAADKGIITFRATSGDELTQAMVTEQIDAAGIGPDDTFTAAFDSSVKKIGAGAFYSARERLIDVVIPNGVTRIGTFAFQRCTSLTSVLIPDSVAENLYGSTFENCHNLTEIHVSPGNSKYVSIDGVVFSKDKETIIAYPPGKSGGYIIPDSVTSIPRAVFWTCKSLTSLVIPDKVTYIEDSYYVFYECPNLVIHSSVDSYARTYAERNGIPWALYPPGVHIDITFYTDSIDGVLTQSMVTAQIDDAGINYGDTFSAAFDESVKVIGNSAFSGTSLSSVAIPDSITSIGNYVFYGCESLESVVIPSSVTSIGNSAFRECTKLSEIYFNGAAPSCINNTFQNTANGAIAYIYKTALGFPAEGQFWNGLVVKHREAISTVTITAIANPYGGGTASGNGIYDEGDPVTVKAVPNENYTFDGWYEDGVKIESAGVIYTFTASEDRTLEARFIETPEGSDPVVKVSSASGRAGSEIALVVTLENNPGIAFFRLTMQYDVDKLTYVSSEAGDIISQNFMALDTEDQVAITAYTSNGLDITNGTILFTIKFKINEGMANGVIEGLTLGYLDQFDGFVSGDNYVEYNINQGSITVNNVLYGDVNGDGGINPADLTRLAQYISGIDRTSNNFVYENADVNGDGVVNPADLTRFAKYISGVDRSPLGP